MTENKIHWLFWVIALLGLLWNIGGCINYIMQTKPDFVASLPETHRAIIEGRPAWATGGFAVGVFGGVIGCLFLLLRKHLAALAFMISLIGILVTMVHTVRVAVANENFSTNEIFVMIILPIIVANFLIGVTLFAVKRNWLS